jgi:hypothetical protein
MAIGMLLNLLNILKCFKNIANFYCLILRRIPVVGKHSRKIHSGCWSAGGNLLALGGELRISVDRFK